MRKFLLLTFSLFSICAFAQDGVLDATFGTSGKSYSGFTGNFGAQMPVAVQSDGKILQASSIAVNLIGQTVVLRYNNNGGLDNTFGNAGKFTNAFATNNLAIDMAIQSDGKIVLAGQIDSAGTDYMMVMRLNTNGTIDAGFGNNGRRIIAFTSQESSASAIAIQPDGKIVVAGYTKDATGNLYQFAIARLTSTGNLDTSFDTDGKQNSTIGVGLDGITDVAIQTDGKIVVSGISLSSTLTSQLAVARYTAAGALDVTFGTSGKTILSGSSDAFAYSMALQPDGKIVVSGSLDNGSNLDFLLARFTTAGVLDNTFNSTGRVITAVGTDDDEAYSVGVQLDGKIVAGGDILVPSAQAYDIAVLRYTSAGALDNSFGTAGKAIVDLNSGSDDEFGMVVSQGSKIIVGVLYYDATGNEIPSAIRLNNSSAFYNPLSCATPPAAPTITISGSTLSSSSSTGNQWYLNGVAINGATSQTYVATASGVYTATVTVSGCNSNASNAITYSVTGLSSPTLDVKIQMAPNPVSNKMVISYGGTGKLTVEVLDLSGRNVLNRQNFTARQELDFSGYSNGTYLVRVINEKTNETVQKLIVKQ